MARVKLGVCEVAKQKAAYLLDVGDELQMMALSYRQDAERLVVATDNPEAARITRAERMRLYDQAIGFYTLAVRSSDDAKKVLQQFARQCGWRSILADVVKK